MNARINNEGSIVEIPRWLFLAALVYAPWAYGSTSDWAIAGLCGIIGVVALFWIVGCLLRRQCPSVPTVLGIASFALMFQGWFLVANARFEYDPSTLEFTKLNSLLPFASGSLHQSLSLQSMTQISAMLVALCFATDMAQRSIWRQRILWTMSLSGLTLVALGLAQRFTNATDIFWGSRELGPSFFGTFRYHSNAGAFLNVVWPIVAGYTALSLFRNSSAKAKAFWVAALVMCLASAVIIASRAAAVVTGVLALLWGAWTLREIAQGRWKGITLATAITAGVVTVLLAGSLAALAGMDISKQRWGKFQREITENNPRILTAQVCLDMIPEAGMLGFGPGTFQTAFPYFSHRHDNAIAGKWIYAHEDYLQTLIEWGYVGGAMWGIVLFGGIVRSLACGFRCLKRISTETRITHFTLLASLSGVLLHALVDFPLQIASIQLYVSVLIGMLWSSHHWIQPPHQQHQARPQRREAQLESLHYAA